MKNKLLGVLLTLCFSTQSLAATFDSTEFSVDGNRFYFDVTLTLTPGNTTFAAFRIATAGTTAMAIVNGERIEINFDPITGALTFPPRVRAYGTPIDNRWQLTETITDFSITENAPGVWRLVGSILHGTAPYTSGDTVAVMTFRDEFTGDDHMHDIPVTDYVPPLQCTMYTDRAAFEVAAPGLPTEDFEKTGVISDFDSPLDATTNIPPIVPGDILSGVAFSNPDFLQRLTLFDGTYASMTSDGISLSNSNDTDGLAVTFNPAVSAFGFDMFSERDSASVRIYNAGSSVLLGSYDGPAPQAGGFLGCVSPVPIGSVTIDAPANASGNIEALDNVSFGEPSVVPLTYTVGGSISGLTGSVTLQNNGSDTLSVAATATSFVFATALADGTGYSVTVSTQPMGQTCNVTNGSGSITTADVTNVTVDCVDDVVPTYSVGGIVSGLTGTGLALQNNGVDTLAVAADGPFTFLTELADSSTYLVTVSAQPTGQTCTVSNESGTIASADVTDVAVDCVDDVVPPVEPTPPATPIPTTSQWALIMLSMLLGLMVFANRRRFF